MTTSIPTEHAEQVIFVQWFRAQYPGVLIFAIPIGGYRDKRTAEKLKAEGVVPGVPDLFIPEWKLFLEFKRKKGGTVSKEQKGIMEHLTGIGYSAVVCRGFEAARDYVLSIKQ